MYLESRKKGDKSKNFEEEGYWRKANAIHGWFSSHCTKYGNIENLERVGVTYDDILCLKQDCERVLNILKTETAEEKVINVGGVGSGWQYTTKAYSDNVANKVRKILPPQIGFFYGTYEIDECYKEDIEQTIDICDKVLREFDFEDRELTYIAWW